jgi:hypothetical protein
VVNPDWHRFDWSAHRPGRNHTSIGQTNSFALKAIGRFAGLLGVALMAD